MSATLTVYPNENVIKKNLTLKLESSPPTRLRADDENQRAYCIQIIIFLRFNFFLLRLNSKTQKRRIEKLKSNEKQKRKVVLSGPQFVEKMNG